MINNDTLMFLTACILIAAGALGNGLEVKEIKIPKISTVSRFLCFGFGLILIVLGFVFKEPATATASTTGQSEPAIQEMMANEQMPSTNAVGEVSENDATASAESGAEPLAEQGAAGTSSEQATEQDAADAGNPGGEANAEKSPQ